MRDLLSIKAAEKQKESDEIHDKYSAEEIGVVKFIKDYRKSRQSFYLLKGKEDRICQLYGLYTT